MPLIYTFIIIFNEDLNMKILSDLIHRSNEDNGIFQISKVIEIQIWHISDFHHSVLLMILKYIIFTELKDQDPE